jgi:hypothetical protein
MFRPDSDLVGRWQVEYQNEFLGEKMLVQHMESWDTFLTLSFQERLRLVSFDNVCSALRRDFWGKCPFHALTFASRESVKLRTWDESNPTWVG